MRTLLDIEHWPRREHFHFFRNMEEPFWGATVTIDCTEAYGHAKSLNVSFFIYYLHKTLVAINRIEVFRYRADGDKIYIYERIDASATISRKDGSFGFSLIEYDPEFQVFCDAALVEIERIQNTDGLFTRTFDQDNLIHFSALPWINFSALSHARRHTIEDSCPKISFGKMMIGDDGKRTMAMSVHVHHGLIDGLQMSQFVDFFQEEMAQ